MSETNLLILAAILLTVYLILIFLKTPVQLLKGEGDRRGATKIPTQATEFLALIAPEKISMSNTEAVEYVLESIKRDDGSINFSFWTDEKIVQECYTLSRFIFSIGGDTFDPFDVSSRVLHITSQERMEQI